MLLFSFHFIFVSEYSHEAYRGIQVCSTLIKEKKDSPQIFKEFPKEQDTQS
jgi:hypothetical protein